MTAKWTVTSQPMSTGQDDSGNWTRGRMVNWQADNGTTGSVFIPTANLTPDYVKAKIAADVDKAEAILGLTSES